MYESTKIQGVEKPENRVQQGVARWSSGDCRRNTHAPDTDSVKIKPV